MDTLRESILKLIHHDEASHTLPYLGPAMYLRYLGSLSLHTAARIKSQLDLDLHGVVSPETSNNVLLVEDAGIPAYEVPR